jgi:glycosyltransferase involved in cell wall biosynthesis
MKILHLTGDVEDNGGILSVIRNLQTASAPWGWEHVVWVHQSYREKRPPPLSYRYSRHLINESERHLQLLCRAPFAACELKTLLKQEKFDVLHAHTRGALPLAMIIAGLWRKPVVYTCHTLGTRIQMYRLAARFKHLHLVLLTHNMAGHYGLTESPPRLSVISACCADRFFEEPLASQRYAPGQGNVLKLVAFGNVVRWKKWDLILEAIARLSEADRRLIQFSLWGPVSGFSDSIRYKSELDAAMDRLRLGSQVKFCGPTDSVADAIRNAHWMVHPTPNEPCSVAMMEALALGLPVLAASGGGSGEMVQPGKNGLHFEPGSASDLAAKLRSLLHDDPRLPPPAEIRQSVRFRSAAAVAGKYRDLYSQILGDKVRT